jgi:predicted Zn-dependent peptidase
MLTPEHITWAYRIFLNQPPPPQDVMDGLLNNLPNTAALRTYMLGRAAFRSLQPALTKTLAGKALEMEKAILRGDAAEIDALRLDLAEARRLAADLQAHTPAMLQALSLLEQLGGTLRSLQRSQLRLEEIVERRTRLIEQAELNQVQEQLQLADDGAEESLARQQSLLQRIAHLAGEAVRRRGKS